jgi:hypothetical protein
MLLLRFRLNLQKALRIGNISDMLASLAGQLRHDDVLPMNSLACNLTWINTYYITLNYYENTMYRYV